MINFISALLEKNVPGAIYEESVFDRWLTLKHKSGQRLIVFDAPFAISETLDIDCEYEFAVRPCILSNLRVIDEIETESSSGPQVCGKVIALSWQPTEVDFTLVHSNFAKNSWVLVNTDLGTVVFRRQDLRQIEDKLQSGVKICWEAARTDLLAVR